jgi:Fur family transcriptional regulator, ferric uptake regulator
MFLRARQGGGYPAAMEPGRNRRNREALLDAGRSIGHAFSARELHERARRDQPRLGLTTAYRAIERWRGEGLVEDAGTRSGEAVFVMCGEDGHHHHLVCEQCGAITTLEGCALTPLRDAAAAVGFALSDRALASLPGRCARCAGT